ncbi:Pyruvate dehydrogenase E1 component subunit alpha, somatic form, mitochondrial [Anthophora plagiata]
MKGKENDTCDDGDDARLKECRRIVRNRNGSVRKRSMFSEYANIFCITLAEWTRSCNHRREDKSNEDIDDLILPSNEHWRYRVYYRLVELQRECDVDLARKRVVASSRLKTEEGSEAGRTGSGCWEWEPKGRGYDLKALPKKERNERSKMESLTSVVGIGGSMTEACVQPGWRVKDILLASEVLRKVKPSPTYSDEAEMRRVFGLVYDVLRYKKVFTRALEDIGFWRHNAAIKDREKIVWLLLYDMQGRKFTRLPSVEFVAGEEREKIFKAAGLRDIEKALLKVKTHLAASISRLRIRSSALKLDELLPTRLRVIEGVSWASEGAIASGWINTEKLASKEEFFEEMSKLNLVCCCEEGDAIELEEIEYAFDPICPKMVNLHESARETLAVSTLVRDHRFIFLERSLCLGAATLARAIRIGRFSGPVILTHSLAPRHTGYLAGLLADIEHAGRLLTFGAGDQRDEYETYLKHLGDVTSERCLVFSEKYIPHPATSDLERATVVLAVPTCSYTGVRDIVDLAVARGGDADLLESLTNAYVDGNDDDRADENYGYNDHEQWQTFMADQMSTLKYALTRPNVQFVVYEVHTILPSETTVMVRDVVDCVNRMAEEKYIREHSRKPAKEGRYETERLDNDVESRGDDRTSTVTANVIVPDSDIFEVGSIEDIYGENASGMLDPGCFLAIIKRKEMMQFDSVFMIDVAESKGLFGDPNVEGRKCPKGQQSTLERSLRRRSSQTSARKQVKRVKKYELYRLESGPSPKTSINDDEATYALKTMNYIRRMENKAAELYRLRLINGFLHLYSGQEAIAVGMKMSLTEKDSVITAYRCHGFAVVFGVSAREVFAELMGRKTGTSKGKGGSMHMYAKQFYGGEGIVGGQVPIGVGLGFAHKYNGTGGVAWALYGDGAASQGQIYEAYNMSKLWSLPVVYICENNLYAMGTVVDRHSANPNFYTRGDLIPGVKIDGMKVTAVREAIKFAREYALRNGPIILEMVTYRYFGHSMSDPGTSYRTRDEVKAVQAERDPILLLGKQLVENGMKTEEEIRAIRDSTFKAVDQELEQAKADPFPDMSDIPANVYVNPLEKMRGKVPWEIH